MPAKGRRTKAGDRTRSAILDAAIKLLGSKGPEGFSASALAKRAGVSKATVFHHFRTLDKIPLVALERFWASSLSRDTAEAASARDYLQELANRVGKLTGARKTLLRAHFVFLVKAMFDTNLRRILSGTSAHMHELVIEELSRRLRARLPPREIETAARMVEMVLDGMMIGFAVDQSPEALALTARAWSRFLDVLLRGLEGA